MLDVKSFFCIQVYATDAIHFPIAKVVILCILCQYGYIPLVLENHLCTSDILFYTHVCKNDRMSKKELSASPRIALGTLLLMRARLDQKAAQEALEGFLGW